MSWPGLPRVIESMIERQLPERRRTLTMALEGLLRLHEPPYTIVECGAMRDDDWVASGRSTLVFQQLVSIFGGQVISVDLDPATCNYAAGETHPELTNVVCRDATEFLEQEQVGPIHLLYLDSVDVDFATAEFSAQETRRHLDAGWDQLAPGAVILVDDTPQSDLFAPPWIEADELARMEFPTGKGAHLFDYPGAAQIAHEYQLLLLKPFTTDSIPRSIHHVFGLKGDPLPAHWRQWMQDTMAMNQGFAHKMWSAADCDLLVQQHDPDFYSIWESIPNELFVVKADYIRLLILLVHGGFYLDCDIRPLAPLGPLVTPGIGCVLFREGRSGLANSALACVANHELMETALNAVREGIRQHLAPGASERVTNADILTWCGPNRIRHAADLHDLPSTVKGVPEQSMLHTGQHLMYAPNGVLICPNEAMVAPRQTLNWFGTHWCDGTWRPLDDQGQIDMDDAAVNWEQ